MSILLPYVLAAGHPLAESAPRLIRAGEDLTILLPLTLAEALRLVELDGWPELQAADTMDPRGLALYPSQTGAPVVVELREGMRDAYGVAIPQRKAVVACIMRVSGRALLRCWVPGGSDLPAVGPLDVRAADITRQPGVYRRGRPVPAALPGWAVGRADPPPSTDGPVLAA